MFIFFMDNYHRPDFTYIYITPYFLVSDSAMIQNLKQKRDKTNLKKGNAPSKKIIKIERQTKDTDILNIEKTGEK